MADIENILNNEGELNEAILLKYLEGKLSREEAYAVEKHMAASDFVNDAVEGLGNFKSKKSIAIIVDELNNNLQQQTSKPKKRREKRKMKGLDGILISVIIVLMLCMLGYAVLHVYEQNKTRTEIKSIPPTP
jgi:hypothetical protein